MCGLAGYIAGTAHVPADSATARHMADTLTHRGPDDGGVWVDPAGAVALAHRRLSIVDLSPAGHQPMESACGRWVIAYNGEVYNANELRALAPGIAWRGHSDTEAILEACARVGIAATVERMIGMFAVALWDRAERCLYLVRDRMGIKPLYWGTAPDGTVLFGSELKALRAHPSFRGEIDRDAVAAYLRFNYVPAPHTIYRGIRKLMPGHILRRAADGTISEQAFWSLRDKIAAAKPLDLDDHAAEDALHDLLRDAVGRRMVADVPVGAFLSGGIDSSTVVALMQAQSTRPVHTFTIGLHEAEEDESAHARAVARHLGTEHTELIVEPRHALDVVPVLAEHYDEPFADSSQIPTFLVSQLARRAVTVSLSGDGGDELFCGYDRFLWGDRLWGRVGAIPPALRRAGAGLAGLLPGATAGKIRDILTLRDDGEMYRRLVTCWSDPAALVPGTREPHDLLWDKSVARDVPELLKRLQFLDAVTYLPDDILCKVDRASMAVALEARVPLLDHRVVEFAFRLPRHQRIRDGRRKWLLRRVLYRYVPESLVERPKMGFGIPVDRWLRGPLRDWAEDLLAPARLEADGLLRAAPIRRAWDEHLSGRRDWTTNLWIVLMLQAWRARWAV